MNKIIQTPARNNLLRLIVIAGLLCGCIAPAARAESSREYFSRYRNLSFYEKKLFYAASREAMKEIACGRPGTKVAREKMRVLMDVRFVPKRPHPVQGIWEEKTHVILCGKSVDVKVTIVARPNDEPVFLAEKD